MTRYAPLWQQNSPYPAAIDRQLIGALWPTGAATGGLVTVVGGTMQVAIAALAAAVPVGTTSQFVLSDASENLTLTTSPPSGQNRIDLVVAQVRDVTLDGGANNDWLFAVVTGTAGASPSPPAVPVRSLPLAQVLVIGASSFLTAGNVTDLRPAPLGANRGHNQLFFNQLAANTGGFGATAVTVGLGGSVVVPEAGHRYRIRSSVIFNKDTTSAPCRANILVDSINVRGGIWSVPASSAVSCDTEYRWAPTAGSHTLDVTVSTDAGAATLLSAADPYRCSLAVDDLGLV